MITAKMILNKIKQAKKQGKTNISVKKSDGWGAACDYILDNYSGLTISFYMHNNEQFIYLGW